MKWLVYLLLVINIGFAAWHFRGLEPGASDDVERINLQDENQLILLSEYRAQQQAKKNKTGANARLCYNLGPFKKKAASKSYQNELTDLGIKSTLRRISDNSRRGFWVVLVTGNQRKVAKEKIAILKQHNVKDFFLIATGTHANEISLGVFSQKKLAARRIADLQQYGLKAEMQDVALPRKFYWLEWPKQEKTTLDEAIFKKWKKANAKLSQVERSCKK